MQWCVTYYKLSAASYDPLTHSRHNAGDRSTKVSHEIKRVGNTARGVVKNASLTWSPGRSETATVVRQVQGPSSSLRQWRRRLSVLADGGHFEHRVPISTLH